MLLSDYGVGIEVQRLLLKGPTPPHMFHRLQLSHRHKCSFKTVIIQCSNSIITIKLSSNVLHLSAADVAAFLIFWIVYDAFEHWKKLLNLLCSCDEALSTYSDIFEALIGRFQILSDLYRIVRNC